ncbi:MAG: DNA polymerase III subunit alpha [Bacteroidales bacterium]|nr:DNA polymerase III subunit alpha [Bacteroidales bacterium]
MYLIFDTETTGLPRDHKAPLTDFLNWPRMVQLAWQIHDFEGILIETVNFIIRPDGFTIPFNAEKIHGISTQMAMERGTPLDEVLGKFEEAVQKCSHIAGHNIEFDLNIAGSEFLRNGRANPFEGKNIVDSMHESVQYCALSGGRGGGLKYPTLEELYQKLFNEKFSEAHNASADVAATARCFLELIRIGVIAQKQLKIDVEIISAFKSKNPGEIQPFAQQSESNRRLSEELAKIEQSKQDSGINQDSSKGTDVQHFTHLHVHSHFSVLEATPAPENLIAKAISFGMHALALTDHGNLFGAFGFNMEAIEKGIKPIIGCEFFMVEDHTKLKFTKDNPDRRTNQVLLAKNLNGYRNLSKLSSMGWIEGYYDERPRIDKALLVKYKDDLIALSGGIYSEINDLILNVGEHQAEEAFLWWKEQFGDDFYVQINRHNLPEEDRANAVLLQLARKHDVKIVAANNVYYIEKEDADLHDSLLCIKNGEYQSTPKGWGRGRRYGFPNDEFYLKTKEEMLTLFADHPEALSNTQEIVDKVETYKLSRDAMMPHFTLPEGFDDPNDYLRHITYRGAGELYHDITGDIRERIEYELVTIKKMGYPDYFLIVEDLLREARKMGVWVGPGRGSAAGSVVAYCLRITNIDPLEYGLLFERFLNPDRISLPDIDIDFDEDGRDRILKWVADKYGHQRVAHIITFGKMAPKMAIRDVARVKQLPLHEANRLSKMIPAKPGVTFPDAYKLVKELGQEKNSANPLIKNTLNVAEKLEGTVRNIGTHACGIIISKDDLTEHIPVSIAKDTDLLVTQFDGIHAEKAGMLKMDFLGLKTLSIIKDAVELIKKSRGIDIDIDAIPHDDEATYNLYSRGDTTAIFQFESDGMKKNLRKLKPNRFEDLIAMNALYRPGPMEYIPNYIARKHGKEKVEYDIPEMEDILKETYGITIYQEQVMKLSQVLANFSGGDADNLRKAMGKKIEKMLKDLKPKFMTGAKSNNHNPDKLKKIWDDWLKFANYAFNKSHATCYAYLSYRMAYLKANYPAEFMAAVLSRNLSDITKITFFIDEVKQMGINVLKPDVNESDLKFIVNKRGDIRFGMGAIKGMGTSVAEAIIDERNANGPFSSIFDFAQRINLKVVNKRSFEALAMAGAFDSFENLHRAQLFHRDNTEDSIFIEKLIRYAQKFQEQKNSPQVSLFGEMTEITIEDPKLPESKPWSNIEQLKNEKEVTGFYITGHPLDDYKLEMKHFTNCTIADFKENLQKYSGRALAFGGMVISTSHRVTKEGKPWGLFTIEDFDSTYEIRLFSEDYLKYKNYLMDGFFLLISAQIQKRYKADDEFELRIIDLQLLQDVIEKRVKNIKLLINIEDLNPDLVDSIFDQAGKHKGNCKLHFQVIDAAEKLRLNFNNGAISVSPATFLKWIAKTSDVDYVLEK